MLNPLLHMVRSVMLTACLPFIVACASSPQSSDARLTPQDLENATGAIRTSIDSVNANLESMRAGLDQQYAQVCEDQQSKLLADYAAAKKSLNASRKENAVLVKRCEAKNVIGKLLFGAIENVEFLDEKITFSARIDTGAETSSLGVYRLQDFERDGKTWVKFKLVDEKTAPTYEYRVSGRVSIKQSANINIAEDERYEIKMSIRIGQKNYSRQVFNLSDRSYLEHQVLIGRSFLTDVAIVDTGSKYRLKK